MQEQLENLFFLLFSEMQKPTSMNHVKCSTLVEAMYQVTSMLPY